MAPEARCDVWRVKAARVVASGVLGLALALGAAQTGCGVVLMEPVPPELVGDRGFDGSVVDLESGAAIANARVRVEWVKDPSIYFETFSDVKGEFSIRYLRKGNDQIALKKGESYLFTVSSADYRTFRRPETFKANGEALKPFSLASFDDNQKQPEVPVPPSPDRAPELHFRSGPPIP